VLGPQNARTPTGHHKHGCNALNTACDPTDEEAKDGLHLLRRGERFQRAFLA
jgi:hypothetical protein